eukprot:scaffold295_cov96-Cylindrotheca_fusiformis.AAC.4
MHTISKSSKFIVGRKRKDVVDSISNKACYSAILLVRDCSGEPSLQRTYMCPTYDNVVDSEKFCMRPNKAEMMDL